MSAGLAVLLDPTALIAVCGGVMAGMLVGAFPGMTATLGVAIASGFTITMDPVPGMAVLLGIYTAAMFGDRLPAILVNTPGTPASIATTFDGYPMARQGRAGEALFISAVGSGIGGLVGILVFALVSFPLARLALEFGPVEFFALVVFALTMMVGVSRTSLLKGLAAGVGGLALATVGADPIVGVQRFTFGDTDLASGLSFIPAMIGLFGVAEVADQLWTYRRGSTEITRQLGRWLPARATWKKLMVPFAIGSGVGSVIGAIPAAGGDIAGLISWDRTRSLSRHPERFGRGAPEGVAASDTANNSVIGGALTTSLALGIPGDSVTAVLLGSLMIWGLRPGPQLFSANADFVHAIVAILVLALVLSFALSCVRLRGMVRLLDLPRPLLWSGVLACCVVGTYSVRNSLLDVWVMLGFAALGLAMRRNGFPGGPMVLGLLLGPLAESNVRRALDISEGDLFVLVSSPIAIFFYLIAVSAVVLPFVRARRKRTKDGRAPGSRTPTAEEETHR